MNVRALSALPFISFLQSFTATYSRHHSEKIPQVIGARCMPQWGTHIEDFFQRPQQGAVRVTDLILVSVFHIMSEGEKWNWPVAILRFIGCDKYGDVSLFVLRGIQDLR